MAAGPSVDPGRWLGVLDELLTRTGSRFRRVEPRRRARAFVLGLLAELPRKNCWTIAEHADRQAILDGPHAAHVTASFYESVLYHQVGPPEVMVARLERLLELTLPST